MRNRLKPNLVFLFGLLSIIASCAYLYSFGLNAGLQFDDAANLSGLKKLNEGGSIWQFVFAGTAGPLGRPVSLLTFALQSHSWPRAPEDFIYVNIAIHLINGCLVTWLAWLLTHQKSENSSVYQALTIGAIWLMMPLLVSSSLMIVQRMATLTATVILVGLIAYVKVRGSFYGEPRRGLIGLSLVLVLFTTLAALVKENGVLFPVYCLAIEVLLMSYMPVHRANKIWLAWRLTFLVAPMLIIGFYLVTQLEYSQSTIIRRGFDGVDRLLYQSQALFQYLFRAIVSRPSALGPFHDQLSIVPSAAFYVTTIVASSAWLFLVSIGLKFRNSYPELLFAVVWFLGGHMLESTTVAIELYFEHRNYLPIFGPVAALVIFGFRFLNKEREKLYIGVVALYLTLSAAGLFMQTSLWGDRMLAANIWTMSNPKSVRAVVHLAKTLRENGEEGQVPRVYANYLKTENDPRIKLYRLVALCKLNFEISDDDKTIDYKTIGGKTALAINMASVYQDLFEAHQKRHCAGLSELEVYRLGEQLLQVPEVSASNIAVHNIYSILTVQAIIANDFMKAKENVYAALKADYYLDTFEVALIIAQHTSDRAMEQDLWSRVFSYRPRHPIKRKNWDEWLDRIKREHPNDSEKRI